MSEQSNLPNHHQSITAVRTILQAVQQPLGALAEALQTPEYLLAELAPSLGVVDFSPFAQLMVNEAEPRQPASQAPLRSTGTAPVATAFAATTSQAPFMPTASPARPDTPLPAPPPPDATPTKAPPVFALHNQKRAATVDRSSSVRATVSPGQSLVQLAAPTTPLARNDTQLAEPRAPLSSQWQDSQPNMPVTTALSAEPRAPYSSPLDDHPATLATSPLAASPLATMPLLATVVDSLLAAPPAAPVESATPQGASTNWATSLPLSSPGGMHGSVAPAPDQQTGLPTSDHLSAPIEQPSRRPPLNALVADLTTWLTSWPTGAGENQPTNQITNRVPSETINQPPLDAWTLSQLINDVLAEEARRHGVDLS